MMCGSIYIEIHKNSAEFSTVWRFAMSEVRTGLLARCFGETMLRGLGEIVLRNGLFVMEVNEQQLNMWQLIRLCYSYQ